MTNEQIKEIALANGFKLKQQSSGEMDLNPYVYDFARALIENQNMTLFGEMNSAMRIAYSCGGYGRKARLEAYNECMDIIQENQTALRKNEVSHDIQT